MKLNCKTTLYQIQFHTTIFFRLTVANTDLGAFRTHIVSYIAPFYLTVIYYSESSRASSHSNVWLWWLIGLSTYGILIIPIQYFPNDVIHRFIAAFAAHKVTLNGSHLHSSWFARLVETSARSTYNAFLVHGVFIYLVIDKFDGQCEESSLLKFILIDAKIYFYSLISGHLISILYEIPMSRLLLNSQTKLE